MRLRGVAARAERTARSALVRVPSCRGDTVIVSPRYTTTIGRETARSILRSAGCAVSPPTRAPRTVTPGAIACICSDAGAAAHAIPATAVTATATLSIALDSTRCSGKRQLRPESSAVRGAPYPRPRMERATWTIGPCPEAGVQALVRELGVSATTASVLARRGYGDPAAARRFLDGALPGHDPFALGDMRAAVDTIQAAVAAGARI